MYTVTSVDIAGAMDYIHKQDILVPVLTNRPHTQVEWHNIYFVISIDI